MPPRAAYGRYTAILMCNMYMEIDRSAGVSGANLFAVTHELNMPDYPVQNTNMPD
jgi:hypothetical protein